mgnify:CR=1 FL=1
MKEMNTQYQLDTLLKRVEKPGRYIGGELFSAQKDLRQIEARFAFAFPDLYEIGMSYLGLQILYHQLNKHENIYCERVFAPAGDFLYHQLTSLFEEGFLCRYAFLLAFDVFLHKRRQRLLAVTDQKQMLYARLPLLSGRYDLSSGAGAFQG